MMILKRFFPAFLMLFVLGVTFTSCDKDALEDMYETESNITQTANGTLNLSSASTGASEDCFSIVYPIELNFENGDMLTVNSDDELDAAIDNWFDTQGEEAEDPLPTFPVTVILGADGSEQEITDEDDLEDLLEECFGDEDEDDEEDEDDDEDEDEDDEDDDEDDWDEDDFDFSDCFTITYPISANLPDGSNLTINNEEELFAAFEQYDEEEDVEIVFPITVTLEDGTSLDVQDEDEIEDLLEECYGDEDEDDDCFEDDDFMDCFTINFPIDLIGEDGTTVTVNSVEDMEALYENEEDIDYEVIYPVTVTLVADGSSQTVNSDDEVEELLDACD